MEYKSLLKSHGIWRNWMKISLNSVFVEDQEQALEVYTGVLGFVRRSICR